MSFNYYTILLLKVNEMGTLAHQNQDLMAKYSALSRNLALFLKRFVYTEQKKKIIETKRENITAIKERLTQIKASMNLYSQIDAAVSSG